MEALTFGFDGYAQVPPPAGGFWRVSAWHDPFDPPPPAPPLGTAPQDDDGHRYDDPLGEFKTLYCATEAVGALGECLGDFAFNAAAAGRIEAFLETEPDAEHARDYQQPLDDADIIEFEWKLGHAPADPQSRCIDVDSRRSYYAAAPRALVALAKYGVRNFDRQTLLDARRGVTRTMAGVWRRDAVDPITRELRVAGLKFTSRLPPSWECWALWEPLPIDKASITVEDVTIDSPQLRVAADMLGVLLAV